MNGDAMGRCAPAPTVSQLRRVLQVGALTPDDLDALQAAARPIQADPRQLLLRRDEDRVVLLLEGTAKHHLVTASGEEVIDAIVGSGHVAGLTAALGSSPTDTDLTSMEMVSGLSVTGRDLRHLVRTRPGVASACLQVALAQQAVLAAERARFAGTGVTERVCTRLLELARRWGHIEDGGVRVGIRITQYELAAWSGASRETVAKILQGLRAAGTITTSRRSLTVMDMQALRRAASDGGQEPLRRALSMAP
jgi:CRP/FNR family transcriptional regulator, cyclic AMP receptor protein